LNVEDLVMKKLFLILSLAALGGCATGPYYSPNNSPYYGANQERPVDQSQWHVVSVTPVAPGTGERLAAASPNGTSAEYSSTPIQYVPQPVYVAQPVYVPQPVYMADPYYYSPLSIGLGFNFGRGWGGHSRGWGGHSRGGVGIGIGTHLHH
jgi:hypothetical protein